MNKTDNQTANAKDERRKTIVKIAARWSSKHTV